MPKLLRPVPFGNALLDSLPRAAREVVAKACGPARLESGDILCKPSDRIQRVYFPTTACISLIAPSDGNETLEVGMVGNEGMFGITVLLDVKTSPLTGLVQGAGHALQMSASRFSRLAVDVAPLRKIAHRYLYVLTAQIAQTAACNRFHSLDSRLARWLLMTRDRAQSDTFRLTHKALASMLGVFPVIEWSRPLMRDGDDRTHGWEARCVAKTRGGETVGSAEAQCTRDEAPWSWTPTNKFYAS